MPYESFEHADIFVDLRSDTLSKPTEKMRDAMRNAVVGDDVYSEDPTIKLLEQESATLLGKECGLFVPSGTMANLIAIMVHCDQRGCEILAGDMSHTFLFEQAGPAQIAGVQLSILMNKPDGTFCLDELRSRIRINPDIHEPRSSLIIVENTHNMCGGKVLPQKWLDDLAVIAKEHKIRLHMDGARLFSAVVQSKIPADRIVKDFDSACFCLSKNLGAPVGSIIVGTKNFIDKAKRMRKVLGGGMRQVGVLGAAGLVALHDMIDRLAEDHAHAYEIAEAIANINSRYFKVELNSVQTNILMVYLQTDKFVARQVLNRLARIEESDPCKIGVLASSRNKRVVRIVLYHNINGEQVKLAIEKILFVMKEFDDKY